MARQLTGAGPWCGSLFLAAALVLWAPGGAAQTGDIRDPAVKRALAERFGQRFELALAAYEAGQFETAFNIWLEIAREGDIAAQRNVAHMLRKGIGTEQDLPRALSFYKRAAKAGLVGAQVNLAAMYRSGEGTDRNPKHAAAWFARAARAGDPLAQFNLGEMLETGEGVPADRDKAMLLYRLAADGGHQGAADRARSLSMSAPDPEATDDATGAVSQVRADWNLLPGPSPLDALYGGTQTRRPDPWTAAPLPQTAP